MPDLATEARELSAATGRNIKACEWAIWKRRADNSDALDEWLRDHSDPMSIGHAGEHVGMIGAMTVAPHPDASAVRAHFNERTVGEQDIILAGLLDCPW